MSKSQMVNIGDYCNVSKGKIGIKKAVPGNYPLVTTAENRSSHIECHFNRPSVIIPLVSSTGHGHASLKRIHYQEGEFAVGSILCTVTPIDANVIDANFLYHYLDVYKEELLVTQMKGMANVTLSVDKIKRIKFPLLPIEKQSEWIRLFEKTTSHTNGLKVEITNQQSLLKKLRQSILQDAISGKLTKQWRKENPDVEPASKLLKRIKAEKDRQIKEKTIKKQKPLPSITKEEIPFELPKEWAWAHVADFNLLYVDCPHSTPKYSEKGYICLLSQNITENGLNFENTKCVEEKEYEKRIARLTPQKNDIIYIREGGRLGISSIIDCEKKLCLGQRVMLFRPYSPVEAMFLNYLLKSQVILDHVNKSLQGAASPRINIKDIISYLIPIPPSDELKVIVSKVNSLFSACDQLEIQITQSRQNSEMLMQAVLKEAFEG